MIDGAAAIRQPIPVLGEYYYLIERTGSYENYQASAASGSFLYRYLGSFSVR